MGRHYQIGHSRAFYEISKAVKAAYLMGYSTARNDKPLDTTEVDVIADELDETIEQCIRGPKLDLRSAEVIVRAKDDKDSRMTVGWRWKTDIPGEWYGSYIEIPNDLQILKDAVPLICKQMIRAVEDVLHEDDVI